MATLKSQNDRLLVIRESGASLPNLEESKFGFAAKTDGLHRNVTVVSQFHDESLSEFAERVMSKVSRELREEVVYRGVVIALDAGPLDTHEGECQRLVHRLAAMLALRPNGSMMFCAPPEASPALRLELLELVGSIARGAPHLEVRVVFPEAVPTKTRKRVKGSLTLSLNV
jgi:hypothetical protein